MMKNAKQIPDVTTVNSKYKRQQIHGSPSRPTYITQIQAGLQKGLTCCKKEDGERERSSQFYSKKKREPIQQRKTEGGTTTITSMKTKLQKGKLRHEKNG